MSDVADGLLPTCDMWGLIGLGAAYGAIGGALVAFAIACVVMR